MEQVERKLAATKMNPKAGGFGKPASIPAPKPKDPQKALGQKSAIKLTLLKVSHYTLLMAVTVIVLSLGQINSGKQWRAR